MNVAAQSQEAVEAPAEAPTYSLRNTWRGAAALFFFDAICVGQLSFAVLLFGWAILVRAPMIVLARKDKPLREFRIKKAAIYLLTAVCIMAVFVFNRNLGARHANDLVKAVEAYAARHGQFPQTLEKVVPEFIASIPLARYTLASNEFSYRTTEDGKHVLSWTVLPPLTRQHYTFEEKRWITLD